MSQVVFGLHICWCRAPNSHKSSQLDIGVFDNFYNSPFFLCWHLGRRGKAWQSWNNCPWKEANVLHLKLQRVVHWTTVRSFHRPKAAMPIITFWFHQDLSHLGTALMWDILNKRKLWPAEGEIAVLVLIADVESSCTTRLNYKLAQ